MRREMVLSGRLIGNYDVDNVKAIYENDQRGLTQPQSEYNSLIGTVGKALAEADAQLETQIGEFVQVARQDHAVDSEEEQIRLPTSSTQLPNKYQTAANLFRIRNRFSRFVHPYPLAQSET